MDGSPRFRDRRDAGEQLAAALSDRGIDVDLVLAIPRGGLPLGRIVADVLDAELDVVVAKKIGAPGNPEFAIGAVADDGSAWRNEEAFAHGYADEAYFEEHREEVAAMARQKRATYRGDRPVPEITGRSVAIVDDGVATGSTMKACLARIRSDDPRRLTVAVPVGPPGTIRELHSLADEVVCLVTPPGFRSVGEYYDRFGQVPDDEAMTHLR